jgi:hypothetical protein
VEGVGDQDERQVAPKTTASTPIEFLSFIEEGKNYLMINQET